MSFLKKLAPIAGALIGASVPGLGPALGSALGGGIGSLLAGADIEDALKTAAIAGVGGYALKGAGPQTTATGAPVPAPITEAEAALKTLETGATVAPTASQAAQTGILAAIKENPGLSAAIASLGLGALSGAEQEERELTELEKQQRETGERIPGYKGRNIVKEYQYKTYQDGGLVGAVDQLRNLRQEFNTGIDSVIGGGGNLVPANITGVQPQPIGFLGDLQRPQPIANTIQPDFQLLSQTLRGAGGGSQMLAEGGYVEGPGSGTSDSIKSGIYQNGMKVQEARLSDGEFVFTERAVRGLGNGDRAKGAAKMYEMMRQYERMA